MDATNRPRPRSRTPVVAAVVILGVLAASAVGFLVAVAVAVYLTFQILTPLPPAPVATATPVVVVTPVFIANPPLIEVAPAVVPDPPRVVRPAEPPPIVTAPVAPKPRYVPKPPPTGVATPKPGPTPDNPVVPDLPHAEYDAAIDEESFDGILSEEYPEPRKLDGKITSYFKFVSPKGDYIGGGKNRSYNLAVGATPPRLNGTSNLSSGAGPWGLSFAAPGGKDVGVGKYLGATRSPFQSGNKPGLSVSGDGRGSNTLTGSFAIWQLDIEDGKVVALAIDFLQRSEGRGPPLLGRLRYKSEYE